MEYKLKVAPGEYKITGPELVSFDKYKVGITSLEMLVHSLKTVKEKDTYWQWIYITLHSAVQAFMVLALSEKGSMPTYSEKSKKKRGKAKVENKDLPGFRLDCFMSLYDKTKGDSIKFIPSGSQDWSISKLHDRRNDFVHYQNTASIMSLSESPFAIMTDCLDYIEFLAFQSNNIIWHDEQYKTETEKLLAECRSVIEASDKIVGGR